ncbi:MAG: hypothetical protein CMJ18_27345 [Phycisphaeraceae bacterium]|nr:hypothetical protein [Phycisphaeraceae bacterium]
MHARRVCFIEQGRVEIETVDVGPPSAGEVLIEAICSVISPGTELANLHARPNTPCTFPMTSGYCLCGRVLEVGAGVDEFRKGQIVVSDVPHASLTTVPAEVCRAVPDGLAPSRAATYVLVAISLQGVRKAGVQLGDSLAVIGLGVIGNLAAQLCRAAGATLVTGVDPMSWRRALAQRCGADRTAAVAADVDRPRHPVRGEGFDIVIEATGHPEPIVDALQLARRLGRVVLLGSTRGPTSKVNFYRDVHHKGLTVVGAHAWARTNVEDVGHLRTRESEQLTSLDLLAARRVDVDPLISDTMPANEAPRAFGRLSAADEPLMTIALDWTA